jgi:hypothetical protein
LYSRSRLGFMMTYRLLISSLKGIGFTLKMGTLNPNQSRPMPTPPKTPDEEDEELTCGEETMWDCYD